uniref:fimbrial protein n=1 Tax=Serratia TaxID=613 RepID=UPI001F4C0808|nr:MULTISPECIES: fimbrial protein [Serratia]ULG12082.1 SefF [Serratia entomophila]ULG12399.1 SefF [Serratia entomophila]ULG18345.1 SefF [Serratia proteamaculans]ULG19681.1 SefF [Serratia proteamaculans]
MECYCIRILGRLLPVFFILLNHASWADTDIHFSGILVAEPCQLATDSEDQIVDFGSIAARQFINNNQTSPKSFNLRLIDCDLSIGRSVIFTFTGDEDADQPGLFAVAGEAKGIAIVLMDDEGNKVQPGKAMSASSLTEAENSFSFQAAVSGPEFSLVSAGSFTSTVMFSLEYN